MRSKFLTALALWAGVSFANIQSLSAAQTAVVKADRVAMRAEPSVKAERLPNTLKKGTVVNVLSEVEDPKAKGNETRRWAQIELPPTVGVWVAAALVDEKSSTIKSRGANLRSGPGKNYSRIGSIDKGATVKSIRTVDGWTQIEPPPSATAYVPADLLDKSGATKPAPIAASAAAPAARQGRTGRSAPLAARPPAPAGDPAPARPLAAQTAAAPRPAAARRVVESSPAPAPEPTRAAPPVVQTEPVPPPPAPTPDPIVTAPPQAAPSTPVYSAPSRLTQTHSTTNWIETKRKVFRQGTLVASLNPKAPAGYVLLSKRKSEGMINYIYTDNPEINVRKFVNKNVLVSGEEWVDPEHKKTPIVVVESIEPE